MPKTNGKYVAPSWQNGSSPAISAAELQDMSSTLELTHAFGICSTAAATAAKTVSVDVSGTLTLFPGLSIEVQFTNANTAASPTLNVNGTGAKGILFGGSAAVSGAWGAGAVLLLTYNGTNWVMEGSGKASTSQYGEVILVNSTTSSSTTAAATPNSVRLAYNLASQAQTAANNKITAGTTPLTPGTSALATGTLYVVYE